MNKYSKALVCSLLSIFVSTNIASAQFTNGQAADLVLGQADFNSDVIDTAADRMRYPYGLVIHPVSGKVYVSDGSNSRILRFPSVLSSSMNAEEVLCQPDFVTNTPGLSSSKIAGSSGSSIDQNGNLWVVDRGNRRILKFPNIDSLTSGAAADLVLGQADFISNVAGPAANNNFSGAVDDIHVDKNGRLWVADYVYGRVLWFDNAATLVNGAAASGVLGKPNFTSTVDGVTASLMAGPTGVFVDEADRLWVADYSNNRVLRFDNASTLTSGASANAVLGQVDFTTNNMSGQSQTLMENPNRMAVDSMGTLWVPEEANRVLGFYDAANKPNGAPADVVLGQPDFTTGTSSASATKLSSPVDVSVDFQGRLLITDSGNSRVVRYAHPAAQPDASVKFRSKEKGVSVFTSGKAQTLKVNLRSKKKRQIEFKFNNSSQLNPDAFVISGSEYNTPKFSVKYLYNDLDVTADIIAGTFLLKNINPGEAETIIAEVTTNKIRAIKSKNIVLTVYSTIDSSLTDNVKAKIFRPVE